MRGLTAVLAMFLACSQTVQAVPPATPASVPLGDVGDREAAGAARMVGNILEYTRWPATPSQIDLCVAGSARHGSRLADIALPSGIPVVRHDLPADATGLLGSCDAVYLGNLDLEGARRWTALARGAPVVTIAENDPACSSEAMFCLVFLPEAMAFELNIDAVSRSGVRIDPRVLRMSLGEMDDV